MASSSQQGNDEGGNREPQRRGPPTCCNCKHPGHYARDCWMHWKDRYEALEAKQGDGSKRPFGRAASPPDKRREQTCGDSFDSRRGGGGSDRVKDLVTLLVAKEEAKVKKKQEKEEWLKLERERMEKEEKRLRKEEKRKQEQEENDQRLARIVNIQFSKRYGMKHERLGGKYSPEVGKSRTRCRREQRALRKHRGYHGSSESESDDAISAIGQRSGSLALTDKRKRTTTTEEEESESSPAATPLMQIRVRRGRPLSSTKASKKMKNTMKPITMRTLRGGNDPTLKGASTGSGPGAREQFKLDTEKYLDGLDYREVQRLCKSAGVIYVRKGQVVAALAEHRAQLANGRGTVQPPAYAEPGKGKNAAASSSSEIATLTQRNQVSPMRQTNRKRRSRHEAVVLLLNFGSVVRFCRTFDEVTGRLIRK
ncbi:hypothetical protein CBR_g40990 [Chara braunii]|uniref:CCHC-type domain-containing protein n=1 Tax=Chara braunii TaxID=69332 RepID=A0A388LUT7_CHABU|nr:hypothetical protein CBR_g40990 [Chara braunii]|eukprot:GBG86087.1 hypothetical protein CBR_g40990 [Chara braunii]